MTAALWPLVAVVTILGLAVGSFLNVVIYRVPRGESVVSPGSHCPRCDAAIKGRHNVPVLGWLVLRGRCASCALPISPRYPLVEAATGTLFAALTLRFGFSPYLAAYLVLAALAVTLTMIALDGHPLPTTLLLPSTAVAFVLLAGPAVARDDWPAVVRTALGGALAVLLLAALSLAFPQAGRRDETMLGGLLGLFLAALSWETLLVAVLAAALLLACGAGGAALATRRAADARPADSGAATAVAARTLAVPLVPCLVTATLLAVFATPQLGTAYSALLR